MSSAATGGNFKIWFLSEEKGGIEKLVNLYALPVQNLASIYHGTIEPDDLDRLAGSYLFTKVLLNSQSEPYFSVDNEQRHSVCPNGLTIYQCGAKFAGTNKLTLPYLIVESGKGTLLIDPPYTAAQLNSFIKRKRPHPMSDARLAAFALDCKLALLLPQVLADYHARELAATPRESRMVFYSQLPMDLPKQDAGKYSTGQMKQHRA